MVSAIAGKGAKESTISCQKKCKERDQGAVQKKALIENHKGRYKRETVLCLEDLLVKGLGFGICQLKLQ